MLISGDNCCLSCIYHNADKIIEIYVNKEKKDLYQKTIDKYNLTDITKYISKKELLIIDKEDKRTSNNIIIRRKKYLSSQINEIIKIKHEKSLIIVLDQLNDQNNLGNIIRTSALMGVDGIILTEHSSAQITNVTSNTSSGATEIIKHHLSKNLSRTLDFLKKNGYWIYSLDMGGKKINDNFKFDKKSVLVIGNEGKGIRKNILDKSDFKISIPQKEIEGIDSYNAANSLSMISYHYKIFN
tara:strand:- start:927 stop:1649 length:723 start_codon:yes stop_codon:yes gene_type:complete